MKKSLRSLLKKVELIDIIFGYLASGEQNLYVTYKELLDKKEHYLLIWKNTKDLYLIHINN